MQSHNLQSQQQQDQQLHSNFLSSQAQNSERDLELIDQYRVKHHQPQQPRVIVIKLKVLTQLKLMEVSFEYDLDHDTPESIVQEMKYDLGLSPQEIIHIKEEIQKIVSKLISAPLKPETLLRKNLPLHQQEEVKQPAILQLYETLESNQNQHDQQQLQLHRKERRESDTIENQLEQKIINAGTVDVGVGNSSPINTSIDKEDRKEEAVIIEERGGAQEHHNQTCDDCQYQNTNYEEGQIKCNVVSNPNNFLNSMILHNKNDLNDPLEQNLSKPREIKRPIKISQKQVTQHDHSDDDSSLSLHRDQEVEELEDLLQQLFPNYQQHYWNDRSTWNPITKHINHTLNESFDLSSHSIDYFGHQQSHFGDKDKRDLHSSPFMIEDLSIIIQKADEKKQNDSDQKHDMHQLDHIHEGFLEGLSSLIIDRRPSVNQNGVHMTVNHNLHTQSHSSDSHTKLFMNSLKNKVNRHSEIEIELNFNGFSQCRQFEQQNEDSLKANPKKVSDTMNPDLYKKERTSIHIDSKGDQLLSTPNFITPKVLHTTQSNNDFLQHQEWNFTQAVLRNSQNGSGNLNKDQSKDLSKVEQQTSSSQKKKMAFQQMNPQTKMSQQITSKNVDSIMIVHDNQGTMTSLNRQKSQIINYADAVRITTSQDNYDSITQNSCMSNVDNLNGLSLRKHETQPLRRCCNDTTSDDYFHFNDHKDENKCDPHLRFQVTMQSQRLQRKYKQMYKEDIVTLQQAFMRIFKAAFGQFLGHYCSKTEKYVKKFQELYNCIPDGIVDANLWPIIMREALIIPFDDQQIKQEENCRSNYDHQSQTLSLVSPHLTTHTPTRDYERFHQSLNNDGQDFTKRDVGQSDNSNSSYHHQFMFCNSQRQNLTSRNFSSHTLTINGLNIGQ